jgi:hypothetical protein
MAQTTVNLSRGSDSGRGRYPTITLDDIYKIARAQGLDEDAARVAMAIAQTEGGLSVDDGDLDIGGSYGPYQFYRDQGQLVNYARALGVDQDTAAEYARQRPDLAAAWALQGYLGGAIRAGQQRGLRGSDLATYAQQYGQVSVSPERAGQNYMALFSGVPTPAEAGEMTMDYGADDPEIAAAMAAEKQSQAGSLKYIEEYIKGIDAMVTEKSAELAALDPSDDDTIMQRQQLQQDIADLRKEKQAYVGLAATQVRDANSAATSVSEILLKRDIQQARDELLKSKQNTSKDIEAGRLDLDRARFGWDQQYGNRAQRLQRQAQALSGLNQANDLLERGAKWAAPRGRNTFAGFGSGEAADQLSKILWASFSPIEFQRIAFDPRGDAEKVLAGQYDLPDLPMQSSMATPARSSALVDRNPGGEYRRPSPTNAPEVGSDQGPGVPGPWDGAAPFQPPPGRYGPTYAEAPYGQYVAGYGPIPEPTSKPPGRYGPTYAQAPYGTYVAGYGTPEDNTYKRDEEYFPSALQRRDTAGTPADRPAPRDNSARATEIANQLRDWFNSYMGANVANGVQRTNPDWKRASGGAPGWDDLYRNVGMLLGFGG